MSSYVFQFFCGDGKIGTRGSGHQGRDMLSLPAPSHLTPPPRPRPSTAPQAFRLPPQSEERGPRERRRRARSNTRARERSSRSPRRRRRSRTPTARHHEQVGPSLPPGNWVPGPNPQFPPPQPVSPHVFQPMQPPGDYMPPPRQAHLEAPPGSFSTYWQWPAAPFPPHPQPQQFNRPPDTRPDMGRPQMPGNPASRPDTRKPAVPLTPPQRKSTETRPVFKRHRLPPLLLRGLLAKLLAKLSWQKFQGPPAMSWLLWRPSQLMNSFFEILCRQI